MNENANGARECIGVYDLHPLHFISQKILSLFDDILFLSLIEKFFLRKICTDKNSQVHHAAAAWNLFSTSFQFTMFQKA